MQMVLVLTGALLSPLLGLALLLWLDRLEEGLPRAVDAALRQPTPEPILAIPLRSDQPSPTQAPALAPALAPAPEPVVARAAPLPGQRPAPVPDLAAVQPAVGG